MPQITIDPTASIPSIARSQVRELHTSFSLDGGSLVPDGTFFRNLASVDLNPTDPSHVLVDGVQTSSFFVVLYVRDFVVEATVYHTDTNYNQTAYDNVDPALLPQVLKNLLAIAAQSNGG